MCQSGAQTGKLGAGEHDAKQGRQIDESDAPLGQIGVSPTGIEVAEAACQGDGHAAGGGGGHGVAHGHRVPGEVRHGQRAATDAEQGRHPADDGAGDPGTKGARHVSLRFWPQIEPHLQGHGPGEAADDDVEGAGAQQIGGHAAEPGTDQHAGAQAPNHPPVHRSCLLVRTQGAETGEDHGGQRGAEGQMGDDLRRHALCVKTQDQHGDDDEAAADTEQPGQHAREGPQHQIAHKQHKHSFNNETAVNLTAIAHKKRDGILPSLYCAD